MAHLLPASGIGAPKGDQFCFYRVMENTACDNTFDDIPTNIHDYKWTDYSEEDAACRQARLGLSSLQQHQMNGQSQGDHGHRHALPGRGQYADMSGAESANRRASRGAGERSIQYVSDGLSGCPPMGVDPRSLIRPLDKSLLSSTRPTGKPYFTQESKPSCPPHQAPLARKGGFNYHDWLSTQNSRLQPDDLKESCLPSLGTWCQPLYVDCCPDYGRPWAFSLSKKMVPYYY